MCFIQIQYDFIAIGQSQQMDTYKELEDPLDLIHGQLAVHEVEGFRLAPRFRVPWPFVIRLMEHLDIPSQAGAYTALVKTFTATVTDSFLTLYFVASEDLPKLSAIEVYQGTQSTSGPVTTTIHEEMRYDHAGRLEGAYHKINNGPLLQLNDLSYTVKDQVRAKKIGQATGGFLQTLDYAYLPNGFLQSINGGQAKGLRFPKNFRGGRRYRSA